MFPLPALSLFRRPVDFTDGRRQNITLFPLFEGTGKVKKLVIVSDSPAQISVVDWRPGLVEKPIFSALRVKVPFHTLSDLEAEDAYQATGWWHYDPWWLLTEPHLCEHPATPPLKTTNCVNELGESVTSLSFTRDLSRVALLTQKAGDSISYLALAPDRLPERETTEFVLSKSKPGRWVLRPFWAR